MANNEFLTVAEVAEVLRVNQQTVRNWIDKGALPAVRIGSRRVRVRKGDLEAFLGTGGIVVNPASEPKPAASPIKIDPDVTDALRAFGAAAVRLADALEHHRPEG